MFEQGGDPRRSGRLNHLLGLISRMAVAERLLRSLSEEQRQELAELMSNALDDAGLESEMARLADALRARRPDLDRAGMMGGVQMSDEEPLGLSDATTALAERADLAELENAFGQDYPGASLDDIDEDAAAGLRPAGHGRRRGPAPHRARARNGRETQVRPCPGADSRTIWARR